MRTLSEWASSPVLDTVPLNTANIKFLNSVFYSRFRWTATDDRGKDIDSKHIEDLLQVGMCVADKINKIILPCQPVQSSLNDYGEPKAVYAYHINGHVEQMPIDDNHLLVHTIPQAEYIMKTAKTMDDLDETIHINAITARVPFIVTASKENREQQMRLAQDLRDDQAVAVICDTAQKMTGQSIVEKTNATVETQPLLTARQQLIGQFAQQIGIRMLDNDKAQQLSIDESSANQDLCYLIYESESAQRHQLADFMGWTVEDMYYKVKEIGAEDSLEQEGEDDLEYIE